MKAIAFFPIHLYLSMCPTARGQITNNNECDEALPLQADVVVQGNITINSAQAWYAINGTGEYMTASTCTGDASIDNYNIGIALNVFNGTCATLTKVGSDGNGASCIGFYPQSDWLSEANEVYHILVSGYEVDTESFSLAVSSSSTPPPGTVPPIDYRLRELCTYAKPLKVGATEKGSLAGPKGPWYSVVGTGGRLAASTCTGINSLDNTTLNTIIIVYTSCVDPENAVSSNDDGGPCGNSKSTTSFQTVVNETYYVHVLAADWTKDIAGIPFGLKVNDISGNLPPTESPSTENGSINHLNALSALAAIPLVVALVYLIKRKKTAEGTNSARAPLPDPPADGFAETLPITLAGTSPSHRHASNQSDAEPSEDGHVLVAVTMAASVDLDGGPLRSNHPAPATIKGVEVCLPQLKDQCRSPADHDEAPVALARVVDEEGSRGAVGE